MSLLDPKRGKRLPQMSWESVLGDDDQPDASPSPSTPPTTRSSSGAPEEPPPPPRSTPPASAVAAHATPQPPPPPPAGGGLDPQRIVPSPGPIDISPIDISESVPIRPDGPETGPTADDDEPPPDGPGGLELGSMQLRIADLSPDGNSDGFPTATPGAPAPGRAGEDPSPTAATELGDDDDDFVLPPIREATPVEALTPSERAELVASNGGTATMVVEAPVLPDAAPAPALPPTHQPDQSHTTAVPQTVAAFELHQPAPTRRRERSRGGGLVKLFLVLLFLGGLIATAVVVGRPYLFPDDWDAAAKPAADEVQSIRGVEFAEPVTVTAEPAATFAEHSLAQLTAGLDEALPVWRAMGLASGDVNDEVLGDLLADWERAHYRHEDGQLYHDDSLAGAALDTELMRAMTVASLDQQFGWTAAQPDRDLDEAALVAAHVERQVADVVATSAFAADRPAPETIPLVFVPPVISYRLQAPLYFAELLPVSDLDGTAGNPLSSVGGGWPGPLPEPVLVPAPSPSLASGERAVGTAAPQDRSFWYLVLAAYLEPDVARTATDAVVESLFTVTDRSGTTCAHATFAGGDVEATTTLRTAIESWVAAAPPAMSAATTVLADGTLQLTSCDPGVRFENGSRLGVARELLGWRLAELATAVAVIEAGGDDTEVASALQRLRVSTAPAELAALPFDTTPAEAAEVARRAVAGVVEPSAPAPADEVASDGAAASGAELAEAPAGEDG